VSKALYDAGEIPIPINPAMPSDLRSAVEGLRVALVGGGVPDRNWADEIEGCDVVVRLKYLGRQSLMPDRTTGERCDITAVNGLDKQIGDLVREMPRLVVLHRDKSQGKPFIYLQNNMPVFTAAASLGLKVLRALIEAGAREVQMFAFDFNTSHRGMSIHSLRDSHDRRQTEVDREDFWFRCSAHSCHEPLSQRNAVRNIANHFNVVARGDLRKILTLSDEHFAKLTQAALDRLRPRPIRS